MKRILALAALIFFIGGCHHADRQPWDEYRGATDRWIVRLALPNVGIWPCRNKPSFDQCYRLQPPQRWHGTWVLGPGEHDERFCWDQMGTCAPEGGDVYTLDWRTRPRVPAEAGGEKFYTVDFVGRRSSYAHDLSNKHRFIIVVDRLISLEKARPAMAAEYFAAFGASNPGMIPRCLVENYYLGMDAWQPDDPACFEMLPDQHWSGRWSTNGEYSTFCPDRTKQCEANGGITLKFTDRSAPRESPPLGEYRIEFIGRRTKVPGHHGQLDVYAHFMIVDRLISLQRIPGQKYTKLF